MHGLLRTLRESVALNDALRAFTDGVLQEQPHRPPKFEGSLPGPVAYATAYTSKKRGLTSPSDPYFYLWLLDLGSNQGPTD